MNKKKLQCPICKSVHEILMPPNKLVYNCPSCNRKVRCMPPVVIEVPKKPKVEKVKAKDIPAKVKEEVSKAVQEVLEKKEPKKKPSKKKKEVKKDEE